MLYCYYESGLIKSHILMKQIVKLTILLCFLFLVSCSDDSSGVQDDPVFSVQIEKLDDGFAFQHGDNTTIFDIVSPSGISGATFTLKSGTMPRQIKVWLHLKGLEEFRLISAQEAVVVSVPSSGGLGSLSERRISTTSEQVISSFDPLWLDVEVVSSSQEIPLQDGYFEIIIPRAFLQGAGNSFEIQWIDFYR